MEQESDGMRFLYGFMALILWLIVVCYVNVEPNLAVLTTAIVVAGAMAGGD